MQSCRKLFQIWDMDLSKKLTALRDKRGVSDREIARSLKQAAPGLQVSATTVGRWMLGSGKPNLEQAVAIADYFNVPISYLAYGDAATAPSELPEDEQSVLRMYRNLRNRGALDEASATEGLALAAQAAVGRIAKGPVRIPDELSESGFESQKRDPKRARDTRRG